MHNDSDEDLSQCLDNSSLTRIAFANAAKIPELSSWVQWLSATSRSSRFGTSNGTFRTFLGWIDSSHPGLAIKDMDTRLLATALLSLLPEGQASDDTVNVFLPSLAIAFGNRMVQGKLHDVSPVMLSQVMQVAHEARSSRSLAEPALNAISYLMRNTVARAFEPQQHKIM